MYIAPLSTSSPRFLDPHVPLHETPDLPVRIPAGNHAAHELFVLLLGLAILLGTKADHRKQVLDLAEHPLLDDFADLFVRRPARVFSAVLGARPERELDHLVAEVLRVRDA